MSVLCSRLTWVRRKKNPKYCTISRWLARIGFEKLREQEWVILICYQVQWLYIYVFHISILLEFNFLICRNLSLLAIVLPANMPVLLVNMQVCLANVEVLLASVKVLPSMALLVSTKKAFTMLRPFLNPMGLQVCNSF